MNEKNRIKLLKLRHRADEMELQLYNLRRIENAEHEGMRRRALKAEQEIRERLGADANNAMIARQEKARAATRIARLCEILDRLAPRADDATWLDVVSKEDLWLSYRADALRVDLAAERPEFGGAVLHATGTDAGSGGIVTGLSPGGSSASMPGDRVLPIWTKRDQ